MIWKAFTFGRASPEVLSYLSNRVNKALADAAMPAGDLRKQRCVELADARRNLDNIKSAIEQGVVTPTTRNMLMEAEERVAHLEAAIRLPAQKSKIVHLPGVVEACSATSKARSTPIRTTPEHSSPNSLGRSRYARKMAIFGPRCKATSRACWR